jgi:hypothetical protein
VLSRGRSGVGALPSRSHAPNLSEELNAPRVEGARSQAKNESERRSLVARSVDEAAPIPNYRSSVSSVMRSKIVSRVLVGSGLRVVVDGSLYTPATRHAEATTLRTAPDGAAPTGTIAAW